MHERFRELLEDTTGSLEHVIAVFLDIRGFSQFSVKVDSNDVATFLRKVYMKLIDEYFADASYHKPTGDGLLVIVPYTEKNLKEVATNTIEDCFRVLEEFASFCADDPMIIFDVPQKIGIGLSRGSVCRLSSGDMTLDYCGRVLNLASRLVNLARPGGIVFDAKFRMRLLPERLKKKFAKSGVYIPGMAERKKMSVCYTKEHTSIPPSAKQPIKKVKWKKIEERYTLKQIKDFSPEYEKTLPSQPMDPDQIIVKIRHDAFVRGRR